MLKILGITQPTEPFAVEAVKEIKFQPQISRMNTDLNSDN